MNKLILNGKEFINSDVTHSKLKTIFDFPDYYGKNLDAFWDCIKEYAIECFQEQEVKIVWKDFSTSKINLGEEADILLELFQEASKQYGGFTIEVMQ